MSPQTGFPNFTVLAALDVELKEAVLWRLTGGHLAGEGHGDMMGYIVNNIIIYGVLLWGYMPIVIGILLYMGYMGLSENTLGFEDQNISMKNTSFLFFWGSTVVSPRSDPLKDRVTVIGLIHWLIILCHIKIYSCSLKY